MNGSIPGVTLPALAIDPTDGSVRIQGCSLIIVGGLSKMQAESDLSRLLRGEIDHKNGHQWLTVRGISFGGQPAGISLGFHLGKLQELTFGVSLPNLKLEGGWPTREMIDREVAFVLGELRKQLGRSFQSSSERFPWGTAWATFDEKAYLASAGLRYESLLVR